MKKCKKCGEIRPINEFYKEKKTKDGHRSECYICSRIRKREWTAKNKKRLNLQKKKWRRKNRKKQREYEKQYRIDHPEQMRNSSLLKMYGITSKDYDFLLAKQKGKCAICGSTDTKSSGKKYLCVDHNHQTDKIRGLLCHKCNRGLGYFEESISFLLKAAKYLEKYS